jgi:hypothetical protein
VRHALLVVALLSAVGCGDGTSRSPASPTPPPTPTPTPTPPPQTFSFSGTVSETAPTASTRIAGARVRIIDGANAGLTAMTDADGAFHLALQPGAFWIDTGAAGYVELSQFVTLSGDQKVTIGLDPVFQLVTTTRNETLSGGGNQCPGYWDDFSASDPCKVEYSLDVHHSGTLTTALTSTDKDTVLYVELYRSADGSPTGAGILRGQDSATLDAHKKYVLQVRKFDPGGGSPPVGTTSFTLTFTRPN